MEVMIMHLGDGHSKATVNHLSLDYKHIHHKTVCGRKGVWGGLVLESATVKDDATICKSCRNILFKR